jgi:uncharacterized protein (DUF2164 family)
MSRIELPKPTHDALARALSGYLKDQLGLEVEGFDAVFLVDFVVETMGPVFYNQGLNDAQAIIRDRLEAITDAIYEIEKPAKL